MNIKLLILDCIKFLVGCQITQIRFRSEIDLSSHSLEIYITNVSYQVMHVTHVSHELNFCLFFSIKFFEFLDEWLCDWNKCLFRPRQEPIDCAFIKQSREFSETISEFLTNGWEAQANMKIISDSINKVRIKLTWRRISSFEFFNVIISSISKESFFLVLRQQSWNLTSRKNHTDELQELFLFDLRISKNKATVLTKSTSNFKVLFDILF